MATGWTIGVREVDSQRGLGVFIFSIVSRPAVGLIKPPIQCVPGAFSGGKVAGAWSWPVISS